VVFVPPWEFIIRLSHYDTAPTKEKTPLWSSYRGGNSSSDSPTTTQRPQRKKEKYAVVAFVPPWEFIIRFSHYDTAPTKEERKIRRCGLRAAAGLNTLPNKVNPEKQLTILI